VSTLPGSIATAAGLFAGTNVDDIVILALLSAASRASGRPRRWEIWTGQYLGFAVVVGVSVAAGRGLALIPAHWLWLLALIPMSLGVRRLAGTIRSVRRGQPPPAPTAGGLFGVAALTITSGADDIAAYTPFFATSPAGEITLTLVVFAVGVGLWCLAGWWLVSHQGVTAVVVRYGHWIIPVALILVGLYTLKETGAF